MKLVVLLAAITFGALGVACNSDDGDPPSPTAETATVSDTPPAEECPLPASACIMAREIETWLRDGDVQSVVQATQTTSFTCPGGGPPAGDVPLSICEGAGGGEVRIGVGTARRYSSGGSFTQENYSLALDGFLSAVQPAAADAGGDGDLRLIAISCLDSAQSPEDCSRSVVIFSAIIRDTALPGWGGIAGGRELLLFFLDVTSPGMEAPIDEVWTGIVLPDEISTIFETGGVVFDLGQVFTLR